MKTCKRCEISKSLYSFHKDEKCTLGRKSKCKKCVSKDKKVYYIKNRTEILEKGVKYQKLNPEVSSMANKKWRKNNKVQMAKIVKSWADKNRGRINANCYKRRALKLKATPDWVDYNRIRKVYEKALWLESVTGLKYHVDHIIPLQGENVCGLHIWENLQILEASINIKKGNRL